MTPFRNTRYHLQDFDENNGRNEPQTPEQLFNKRHASLRNVVERIFGVLKNRFNILTKEIDWPSDIKVKTVPALAAIHNFIRITNRIEVDEEAEAWNQEQQLQQELQDYLYDRVASVDDRRQDTFLGQGLPTQS